MGDRLSPPDVNRTCPPLPYCLQIIHPLTLTERRPAVGAPTLRKSNGGGRAAPPFPAAANTQRNQFRGRHVWLIMSQDTVVHGAFMGHSSFGWDFGCYCFSTRENLPTMFLIGDFIKLGVQSWLQTCPKFPFTSPSSSSNPQTQPQGATAPRFQIEKTKHFVRSSFKSNIWLCAKYRTNAPQHKTKNLDADIPKWLCRNAHHELVFPTGKPQREVFENADTKNHKFKFRSKGFAKG